VLDRNPRHQSEAAVHRSRLSTAVIQAFALGVLASPVRAQTVTINPLHVGVIGGVTIPQGDFRGEAGTGWNAGALVTISAPLSPVSFRLDGQWHQMNGPLVRASDGEPSDEVDFRIIDGTANVVYTWGAATPAKFYFIGGAGVYFGRGKDSVFPNTVTSTNFGLNAGLGVKFQLSGLSAFVEGRYHYIFNGFQILGDGFTEPLKIIPICVGIVF
jgi:hypothetical protein